MSNQSNHSRFDRVSLHCSMLLERSSCQREHATIQNLHGIHQRSSDLSDERYFPSLRSALRGIAGKTRFVSRTVLGWTIESLSNCCIELICSLNRMTGLFNCARSWRTSSIGSSLIDHCHIWSDYSRMVNGHRMFWRSWMAKMKNWSIEIERPIVRSNIWARIIAIWSVRIIEDHSSRSSSLP